MTIEWIAVGSAKLVLDSSKAPSNAVGTDGDAKGRSLKGIYELDGENFKICFGGPGKDRTTELSVKEGSGARLTVWKKK